MISLTRIRRNINLIGQAYIRFVGRVVGMIMFFACLLYVAYILWLSIDSQSPTESPILDNLIGLILCLIYIVVFLTIYLAGGPVPKLSESERKEVYDSWTETD